MSANMRSTNSFAVIGLPSGLQYITEWICLIRRLEPSLSLIKIVSVFSQMHGVSPQFGQGSGSPKQTHGETPQSGQGGASHMHGSLPQTSHTCFSQQQGSNPHSLQGSGSQVHGRLPQTLQSFSGGNGSPSHSGSAKL